MYSTSNPFNQTIDDLIKPNENDYGFKSVLGGGNQILEPVQSMYNPYPELEQRALEGEKNEKVPDFTSKQVFRRPKFAEQAPEDVLINMNVEELRNDFIREERAKDEINNLFNRQEPSTDEQRAKSEEVEKLLSEIDNFSKQYNLSQRQKETLKTQILSNHLGEYIKTLATIRKEKQEKEKKEKEDLARGNVPSDKVVRDPVNGLDEYGIPLRPEQGTPGETPPLPNKRERRRPDEDEPVGGRADGGSGVGGVGDATASPNPQAKATEPLDFSRDLAIARKALKEKPAIQMILGKYRIETLKSYTRKFSRGQPLSPDGEEMIAFFNSALPLGSSWGPDEVKMINKIITELKKSV